MRRRLSLETEHNAPNPYVGCQVWRASVVSS
jgi:hypothetical protein